MRANIFIPNQSLDSWSAIVDPIIHSMKLSLLLIHEIVGCTSVHALVCRDYDVSESSLSNIINNTEANSINSLFKMRIVLPLSNTNIAEKYGLLGNEV